MSHTGQCLCGGFAFEVREVCGPFELCHCSRCRKASGLPVQPDKHIYVDFAASWDHSEDGLPRYTQAQIREHRNRP